MGSFSDQIVGCDHLVCSETYIVFHVHSIEMYLQAVMDELSITQTKQTFKRPIACMDPGSKDMFLQMRVIVMLSFSRFMLEPFIDFMWTHRRWLMMLFLVFVCTDL